MYPRKQVHESHLNEPPRGGQVHSQPSPDLGGGLGEAESGLQSRDRQPGEGSVKQPLTTYLARERIPTGVGSALPEILEN